MKIKLKKNGLRLLLPVLAMVLLFVCGGLLISYWEKNDRLHTEPTSATEPATKPAVYLEGTAYVARDDLTTVLFIGVDNEGKMKSSGSYLNDGQCDFLMLAVYDKNSNKYSLLQLDRDTVTEVKQLGIGGEAAGSARMQLALSHTYGDGMKESCKNTVDAVENLLYGTKIHHYFAINMSGLTALVDAMGGIEATVREDFSKVDPSLVKGKTMKLSGEQCLTYLRGRKSVGKETNASRAKRQREFLLEVIPKAEAYRDSISKAIAKVADYMLSDLNAGGLSRLTKRLGEAELTGILTPEGKSAKVGDYMEFHVEEEALKRLVTELFYEKKS